MIIIIIIFYNKIYRFGTCQPNLGKYLKSLIPKYSRQHFYFRCHNLCWLWISSNHPHQPRVYNEMVACLQLKITKTQSSRELNKIHFRVRVLRKMFEANKLLISHWSKIPREFFNINKIYSYNYLIIPKLPWSYSSAARLMQISGFKRSLNG